MSGNEIISIHLGAFANFVAAYTWNLDYIYTSKNAAISLDSLADSNANDVDDELKSNPNVLFKVKTTQTGTKLFPRAIFCDFVGSVPAKPLSVLASKERLKVHDLNSGSSNPLHMSWGGKWSEPSESETSSYMDSSWHQVLLEPLRPLENSPRSLCLAPGPQSLASSCELFSQGKAMCRATTGHGEAYLDSVMESVRWHAEDCDSLQAFRLFVEADSAWAGFAVELCTMLADEFPSVSVLVFSTCAPVDIHASTPSSIYPLLWSVFESNPACPADWVSMSGTNRVEGEPAMSYSNFTRIVPPNTFALAHTRRAANLALLVTQLSVFDSVFHVPLTTPHQQDLITLLASASFIQDPLQLLQQQQQSDTLDTPLSTSVAGAVGSTASYLREMSRVFPANAHALATAATLAVCIHSLCAPTYYNRGHADISISSLVAILKPRPKLCVGAVATVQNPDSNCNVFANRGIDKKSNREPAVKNAGGEEEEEIERFSLTKVQHKGELSILSPLFTPSSSYFKGRQAVNTFNMSPSVKEETESLTKLTSVSILHGSLDEHAFRTHFAHPELSRATIPRHAVSLCLEQNVILPPNTSMLGCSGLFSHAPLSVAMSTRMTLSNRHADTPIPTVVDVFTSKQLSTGFVAMKARLKQARMTSALNSQFAMDDWGSEDWEESIQTINILNEEYSDEY